MQQQIAANYECNSRIDAVNFEASEGTIDATKSG